MVEFTKYIRPICMLVKDPPVDSQASIVGKGIIRGRGGFAFANSDSKIKRFT